MNDARSEGLVQGLAQGETRVTLVICLLIDDGKPDLIERIAMDKDFREQLYKEYHID
ncbi:MAG: hypothetical protein J6P61_09195 [Erysipelotrichaceae bacterium]|nr:hypothetical protein [Erysipelotrichaceae bacterium]